MIIAILIFLVITFLYLLMIFPRLGKKTDPSLLSVDYAHRGYHNADVPENSIGAFEAAVEKGIGIELDIQLSKDGELMVFHDDSLKRVCGVDAKLSEFTAEELGKMKLFDTDYTIPTFNRVLSTVDGRVPLIVEFKPGGWALCKKGCDMLDGYNGRFVVESFDSTILNKIKKYRPEFTRVQLVGNMFKAPRPKNFILKFFLTFTMLNFLSRPDFISIEKTLRYNPSVAIIRRILKIPTFVWTVKNEEELKRNKSEGLIPIFDRYD